MDDFDVVYQQYFRDVYRYVLSLCRDGPVAEEVTQETFFKALNKFDSFKGECKISVWLCQIAKNTYLSHRRKESHFDRDADMSVLSTGGDLEERYLLKESAQEIHRVLRSLDGPYKEVFSLRTFGQLTYRQIGELFGKTETWARVTYHRAKLKIREELE